jgi:hypothetical protein
MIVLSREKKICGELRDLPTKIVDIEVLLL